ncbi:MAG: SET domain-containing protein-lysine N-methyltransferase [Candidatus Wallbacteria bacterium]|nr:SET domain-containing protein-lysine N-methyltransferase [Candidatus Wallbacteria bacterium]
MKRPPRLAPGSIAVRGSSIHGTGVWATRPIPRGTRILEYTGERISVAEADRRYDGIEGRPEGLVVLFQIEDDRVIDAGRGGNDARFVNHSCEPNCESVLEDGRVFIRALRDIDPGEELAYDYKLRHETAADPETAARFACRCGAPSCRGTLLARRRRGRKG